MSCSHFATLAQRNTQLLDFVFGKLLSPRQLSWAIALVSGVYVLFVYSNAVEWIALATPFGIYVARLIVYGIVIASIVASLAYALQIRVLSKIPLLLATYFALLSGIIIYHIVFLGEGTGPATKSFIAGILQIVGFAYLLGLPSAKKTVNYGTTFVFLVACLLCLFEVWVPAFTETVGRGAGLYSNPNIAALALLLGTLGVWRCWDYSWRLPILSVLILALLATLSRSGLIVAAGVALAYGIVMCRDPDFNFAAYRRGRLTALIILCCGLGYLGFAYLYAPTYPQRVVATKESVLTSLDVSAADENCRSWTVIFHGIQKAKTCAWLGSEYIERQEPINSSSARLLLTLRGIATIIDAPWIGIGLDQAFNLRPHNSYLLFGMAYGVVGMLFIPAVGFFIYLRTGGWKKASPLLAFIFLASIFSHDIFLLRDLLAGIAIALSSSEREWPTAPKSAA